MEQKTLFHYRPSKRTTAYQVLLSLIVVFILGCLVSIFIAGAISFVVDKLFSIYFPGIIFLITYIAISLSTTYIILATRTRNLILTTDQILWENSLRQTQSIHKIDVTKVKWKNRQLQINDSQNIYLPSFSYKDNIILNWLLLSWLPSHVLDDDTSKLLRLRKSILEETNFETLTLTIETNRRKHALFRGISFAALVVVLFLLFWTFADDQNGFGVAIGLSLFIISIISTVWLSTRYRAIVVQQDGILYQRGKKENLFAWENIEAIGFNLNSRWMYLWIDGKQTLISYAQMNVADVNDLGDVVYKVALSKNIPIGIV